jgi:3-methyladenine DNA glycosylase Mpg
MKEENITFDIDEKDIETSFDLISQKIFSEFQIVANVHKYRIIELEFYYYSEQHKDFQTYRKDKQKTNGEWFFHYSGIDITIGNKDLKAQGGILIRSIGKLDINKQITEFICGPLRTKDELLNNYNSINSDKRFLYLDKLSEHFTYNKVTDYEKTVRIGIDKNKNNFDKEYRHVLFSKQFPSTYRPKINL